MIQVDVRILAATNCDLKERIRQGLFRQDLYFRISALKINIPPLRERREEIIPMANQFIRNICNRQYKPVKTLSDDAKKLLESYNWPGNIRELQNILEGLIGSTEAQVIDTALLRNFLDESNSSGYENDSHGEDEVFLTEQIETEEKQEIIRLLRETKNNKTKVANDLGISRKTLYKRLKKYHIR